MTDTEIDEKLEKKEETEKFLFNVNIFDDGYVEEVEEEEPPPPTFSEEELAEAKMQSFNQGKDAGATQEIESREQHVADSIEVISKTVSTLIDQESERENLFDTEVAATFFAVFKKLYPHFETQHGLDEMLKALESILKSQHSQKQITILTHPDVTPGIDTMLKERISLDVEFIVKGDETLSENQCKLAWADGGAIIDRQKLAQEIEDSIKQVLAGRGVNVHDGKTQQDDEENAPIQEDAQPAEERTIEDAEGTKEPVEDKTDDTEDVKDAKKEPDDG